MCVCQDEAIADLVLFHSALGLTEGMSQLAAQFSDAGHAVHTPDYYDGHVFDSVEAGIAYRDGVGFPELAKKAASLIADLEGPLVFGGWSLGAAMAQSMGKRDPRAVGALLFHAGGVPKKTSWQAGVPLQIHYAIGDEWIDAGAPELLVASVAEAGASAAQFVYPGDAHLFTDPSAPEYDEDLACLLMARVQSFLAEEVDRDRP